MSEDPREALLDVARDIVAKRGYVGLTMRTASAAVGVTPEVARRYYRNREALFAAAMRLPADPVSAIPTLMAPGIEGMGERLVRFTLDTLRDPEARNDLMSLARTGVAAGHAVTGVQDFIEVDVVDRIATMIGVPDARMRSALISSYLLGVATMRYGVRLEPLASASDEEVIRMVAPVIQDLLDPRKPVPGSPRTRSEHPAAHAHDEPAETTSPTTAKRAFDPDPAATRAKQAARLAAATKPPPPERTSTARPAPRSRPAAKASAARPAPAKASAKKTTGTSAGPDSTATKTSAAAKSAARKSAAKESAARKAAPGKRAPSNPAPGKQAPGKPAPKRSAAAESAAGRPAAKKPRAAEPTAQQAPAGKRSAGKSGPEQAPAGKHAAAEERPRRSGDQIPDSDSPATPPPPQRRGSPPAT